MMIDDTIFNHFTYNLLSCFPNWEKKPFNLHLEKKKKICRKNVDKMTTSNTDWSSVDSYQQNQCYL